MAKIQIKGAIHVHSDYSDGTGSVENIVAAAKAAGLDYVILTDHDTTEALDDGWSGRHDGVLVVVGAEISPPRRGHCLCLGADDVTGYRWMPDEHYLHKLRRQGADVYIAHPEGRIKTTFGLNLKEWRAWESEHFDGIEIWSYMHDWVENLTLPGLPKYYLNPDAAIDGPDEHVLALWDRLNLRRKVVGLGALDAHAVRMFFGLFTAFPYEFLFRTVLTHAIVDDWGGDAGNDTARLRDALRAGRSFVSYEGLGRADGFCFEGNDGDLQMGDRKPLARGATLEVSLPQTAQIALIHNGSVAEARTAQNLHFKAASPGIYRVEARLEGRPWVFSNPICLA